MTENMADLRYPIGEFEHTGEVTEAQRRLWIDEIEALPEQLREAVNGLTETSSPRITVRVLDR